MKPLDIPHLESMAAKGQAGVIDYADILAVKQELERLQAENRELKAAYQRIQRTLQGIYEESDREEAA